MPAGQSTAALASSAVTVRANSWLNCGARLCRSVTGAVEHMVIDCLAAADHTLRFTDDIHDPERYLMLDDSILSVSTAFFC